MPLNVGWWQQRVTPRWLTHARLRLRAGSVGSSPVTASDVSEPNDVTGRFVQLFILVMFLANLCTLFYKWVSGINPADLFQIQAKVTMDSVRNKVMQRTIGVKSDPTKGRQVYEKNLVLFFIGMKNKNLLITG